MAIQWTLHVTSNVHGYRTMAADSEKDARKKYQGILNLYKHPNYKGQARITKAFIEAPDGRKTTIK